MRHFLHKYWYGMICRKGVVTASGCENLAVDSLTTSNPMEKLQSKHKDQSCIYKTTSTVGKKYIRKTEALIWHYLQQHADILAGHVSLGIHENWFVNTNRTELVDAQYVTFIREPYAKFVSAIVFKNRRRRWTFIEAVKEIKADIRGKAAKEEYYNFYYHYLTTPHQKLQNNSSDDKRIQLIKNNLIEMNVMIGAVEHMVNSMALIQSIIDVDGEVAKLFDIVDYTRRNSSSGNDKLVLNKSRLSTPAIVAALREDKGVWDALTELLRYEFEVYDFALELHCSGLERGLRSMGCINRIAEV